MDDRAAIIECEQAAEAAYAAMYDAPPYRVKDCRDDARSAFNRGIEIAKNAGLAGEVRRLSLRLQHVEAVYNSQFRGVGR